MGRVDASRAGYSSAVQGQVLGIWGTECIEPMAFDEIESVADAADALEKEVVGVAGDSPDHLLTPAEVRRRLPFDAVRTSRGLGWGDAIVAERYEDVAPTPVQIEAETHHRLLLIEGKTPEVKVHCKWDGSDRGIEYDGVLPHQGHTSALPCMGIIPAGRSHYWDSSGGPSSCRIVLLAPEYVQKVAEELEIDHSGGGGSGVELFDGVNMNDSAFAQAMLPLFKHLDAPDPMLGPLLAETVAHSLATHLLDCHSALDLRPHRRSAAGKLSKRDLARLRVFVTDHLETGIGPKDLAAAVGKTQSHFGRVMRNTLGMTPGEYIIRIRVNVAIEMLRTTRFPLCNIAERCGCCSQSHFGNLIKNLCGLTPRQIRAAGN